MNSLDGVKQNIASSDVYGSSSNFNKKTFF